MLYTYLVSFTLVLISLLYAVLPLFIRGWKAPPRRVCTVRSPICLDTPFTLNRPKTRANKDDFFALGQMGLRCVIAGRLT
jgi:hypothetical protein